MRIFRHRRRLIPSVAVLILPLITGSCGLPTPSILPTPYGPLVGVIPGTLSFNGSKNGYPNMLGYEIFYKLVNVSEATPDVFHHDELHAAFGRMFLMGGCDSNNHIPPIIDISSADSPHTVFLDFTFSTETDSEPHLHYSWTDDLTVVSRGVADDLSYCRRFSTIDSYEDNDQDVTTDAIVAITERSIIDIIVYVVSYGRDKGIDLYGEPLLVGRLRLDDFPY